MTSTTKSRRPRRPRITRLVLDGIIAATSEILAGEGMEATGCAPGTDNAVRRANEWAHDMVEWMDARSEGKK